MLAALQVTALSDQGMASAPNGVNLTVIARKDDNTLPQYRARVPPCQPCQAPSAAGLRLPSPAPPGIAWVTSLA
ncbi:hypothetical protein [Vibrio lentus]|uniref:hypothetical protein n=1 Tax=Vibrio lentus TaxID=136468 RepID=UPI0039A7562E